ncbi:hypothetical protein [Natrinema sp. 1APR25-10V2]|uniref:DUF7344 domain-containing protein n=1 Tax=Natrinema sp. 1APR25-10V2 TaxID=2951081 RepID=UPI002874B98E|nr:hypothetical protein [Natrinema sp. 1APR25-10V2]MDS0475430.1 hypothetical protein [Natrinema sp. 1APR25-10V2]
MADRNTEGGAGDESIDASFDALSDAHRRSLCRYVMQTAGDTATYEEFVDHVLEDDSETALEDLERQTVELELRHTHLPKLDAVGVVDYDPQGETVRVDHETLTDRLERVRSTVDDLQEAGPDRDDE